MKNEKNMYLRLMLLLGFIFMASTSCEREISDEVEFATLAPTAEIFTDAPIGLGSLFYLPYGPDANNPVGSKPTAWSVDEETSYEGSASMRIDVPNSNDPEGNYAGAILRIDGPGRDLTGYDALTFWAKASQGAVIDEIGFGEDFGKNRFITTLQSVSLSTQWAKFIIPIPDAFKLNNERGMLRYSAGSINGYTFWIDELKFEKLGTIAQPQPAIANGADIIGQGFAGAEIELSGLTQTFNSESGQNITVSAAPSYFTFTSSDLEVARVSELGVVSIVGGGTAVITANIAGVAAEGSLTVDSSFNLVSAPIPPQDPSSVISIYSNQYTNVNVDTFNGNFGGSTTQTAELKLGDDDLLFNSNTNFAGIQFQNPTVDATDQNFLHLDIYPISSPLNPNLSFSIRDRGANGELNTNVNTGGPTEDDSQVDFPISAGQLTPGQWISIDIPLTGSLANQKNNLAQITFAGNIDFVLDNVYFYSE